MADPTTEAVEGPFIETSYPGQPKRTRLAPKHIYDHYNKHPDSNLPFIEPVGKFKEVLEHLREVVRKNRDFLKRKGLKE